ncbi:YqzK family protein [Bacillus sp. AGMB 02131]|uniref:YqzK family protein n=1 Tax=Peribacillus faecalis TaxID=2772559 RepID=A0A927HCI6_9BACI|nr:YqzK family protein [Peribacillus faecalis]MBD3109596.1 YqzK family protein [Peribacillus faecalis]
MKSFIKNIWYTMKVFLLFVSFTIIFYIGMVWLNEEYQNYNRYDEPDGQAIKVSSIDKDEGSSWFNRLKLFYLNGE